MPYNLIAYFIYGCTTYIITVKVGRLFHRNGIHFIKAILQDHALAESLNNMLLVCYYLTNLGYITLMIWFWEQIPSFPVLLESLSAKVAMILLLLGALHFLNMTAVYLLSRKNIFHH